MSKATKGMKKQKGKKRVGMKQRMPLATKKLRNLNYKVNLCSAENVF